MVGRVIWPACLIYWSIWGITCYVQLTWRHLIALSPLEVMHEFPLLPHKILLLSRGPWLLLKQEKLILFVNLNVNCSDFMCYPTYNICIWNSIIIQIWVGKMLSVRTTPESYFTDYKSMHACFAIWAVNSLGDVYKDQLFVHVTGSYLWIHKLMLSVVISWLFGRH